MVTSNGRPGWRVWAQYIAARTVAAAMTMRGAETNLHTAAAVGRLMYRWDHRHRERTLGHLRMSFPEYGEAELKKIAAGSFEHLIELIVELCHFPRLIHPGSWQDRIELTDLGETIDLLNSDRPVILVTGHLGNWEVLGYLMAVLGYRVEAVARPLNNPLVNSWLLGVRERRGLRVLTKWDATDRMVQVLQGGGALGFIADQNAGEKGLFVPFFGRLASTYKSIGLLALQYDAPVVCGYARRLKGRYRYELGTGDIIRPEDWQAQPDPLYYITARYMRAIESMIRGCPHQYLWMHRRWKSRPRHERAGKPLPDALRRKLEALPWMDQTLLGRVSTPVEGM